MQIGFVAKHNESRSEYKPVDATVDSEGLLITLREGLTASSEVTEGLIARNLAHLIDSFRDCSAEIHSSIIQATSRIVNWEIEVPLDAIKTTHTELSEAVQKLELLGRFTVDLLRDGTKYFGNGSLNWFR